MPLNDSTLTAFLTWSGGAVTWGFATMFEWVSQDIYYRREHRAIKAIIEHDPAYAEIVGDVDASLAYRGVHRPSVSEALFRNAPQPLLVLSILALTVFRPLTFSDWFHHVVAAMGAIGVTGLTFLHEYKGKTDWAKSRVYQAIIYLSWVAYFFLVLWLVPTSVSEHTG